uniref:Uncharacterized protein n=1 Tax=Escherichia coli TaxID=562 RepID=A0A1W5T7X5_ECOLX|nr:hypothetical protein [Escherichia coli]
MIVAVSERKPPARVFLRETGGKYRAYLHRKRKGVFGSWYGKPTKQGQEFCAALPPEITKPDISALWAEKQSQIKPES